VGGSEISGVPPLPGIFKWNSPESFLLFFPGTFCKIIKVIDKKQTNKQQKQTKKSPFVNLQLYNSPPPIEENKNSTHHHQKEKKIIEIISCIETPNLNEIKSLTLGYTNIWRVNLSLKLCI
jgi:hypothetical protein